MARKVDVYCGHRRSFVWCDVIIIKYVCICAVAFLYSHLFYISTCVNLIDCRVGCVCVESDEPSVVMESEPLPTVLSVKSAGHDLLVLTTNGLYVLNPDSLTSFPIRSSTDGTVGDMTGSQVAVPGKFVQWEIFETTERGETTLTALALDYTFVLLAVNRWVDAY